MKSKHSKNNQNRVALQKSAVTRIKTALWLASLLIVFIAVFRLLKVYDLFLVGVIVYTVIGLAAALYYIIYNRGVLSGTVTPEMLPADWDADRKNALIADMASRRQKSRWVLLIIIPTLATFGFELLERYFFPTLFSLIGI